MLIGIGVIEATTTPPDYFPENNELNSTFSSSDGLKTFFKYTNQVSLR